MAGEDSDTASDARPTEDGLPLDRLKRQLSDFHGNKDAERRERQESRRYYHGAHWTAKEIATLNKRRQPVVTFNRISRKIDGTVGLLERLRQDPKAYPRSPNGDEGASIATFVLNYALDTNQWKDLSPDCAHRGAVDGIGGVELGLEQGDHGDPDVTLREVDPDEFFYDPRSKRADFDDARFQGVEKWVDLEDAVDLFPDHEDALRTRIGQGGLSSSSGRGDDENEQRWHNVRERKLRLVEHWYRHRGEWWYCFYTGDLILDKGPSPFKDEKGKTFCRFIMFSNNVDHDMDRYGFVRQLKSPNDEINQRRSKGLHLFNSRRIIAEKGAVSKVDEARAEAARADGYIEVNNGKRFEFDDVSRQADAQGNLAMLTEAKSELENFGPNPALVGQGTGVAGSSGRAISLLQQAGIADLGPFILRYRGWKLRVYRAVWNAVQQFWTGERWIRVTDSDELTQFVQVNGLEMGPAGPQLVNALGSLDVDIILDEGPDQINSMADALDTLLQAQQRGSPIPPDVIIELMSLPASLKRRILEKMQPQPPDPLVRAGAEAEVAEKQASAVGKQAKAAKDTAEAEQTRLETGLAAAPFQALAPLGPVEQALVGPAGMPPAAAPAPTMPPGF
jgi:hypothetical protein